MILSVFGDLLEALFGEAVDVSLKQSGRTLLRRAQTRRFFFLLLLALLAIAAMVKIEMYQREKRQRLVQNIHDATML